MSWAVSILSLTAASAAVQLKVICTLRHQEIGNLFGVCKELRSTVRLPCSHVIILQGRNTYITNGWTVPSMLALSTSLQKLILLTF